MATHKIYLAADDLRCTTRVTGVAEFGGCQRVRCEATVFHAQGGGQKGDRGTINGLPVTDARHAEDGEIEHLVEGGAFAIGDVVNLEVDQAWRDEGRRWHSAGHLIADCVTALDPCLVATRGHHWPGEGRVEFSGDANGLGLLTERLTALLRQAVDEDVPFRIVGDPYRHRAIQIGNGTPVGCGGTHVASAGALVGLSIRKIQQKEGMLRVSYGFA